MEVLSSSTCKTEELAGRIAGSLKPNDVLALYGDLGSGKTTFTGFLVKALGIAARIQSPSFVIMRRYENGGDNISAVNHIDLYRLQDENEVNELGLGEVFIEPNCITVIEWPELAEKYLPKNSKKIYFEYVDENTRRISVQGLN